MRMTRQTAAKRIGWQVILTLALTVVVTVSAGAEIGRFRRLPVKEYRDKMKAGWIGQIAGVSWGAPTEFRFRDQIMPAEAMPKWTPAMINHAFGQDDLYVEMTFLRSMEQYGLDVPSAKPASISPTAVIPCGAPTTPAGPTSATGSPRRTPAIPSSIAAPTTSTTRSKPTTPA